MSETGRPLGVLVVDDSAFMRKLIGEMVGEDPRYDVVGFARDGVDAVAQVERLDPDIVTLDIEMPKLDGLRVLEQIMRDMPRPVVVLSAGGEQFGDATLRALELGAVDFVRKPSGSISLDLPLIRDRLLDALQAAASANIARVPVARSVAHPALAADVERGTSNGPAHRIVVVASSTGGPRALAELVPALPASLGAAVVIAQHLPREFTTALAERLARTSVIRVCEARDGAVVESDCVYLAPGGMHTSVRGSPGAARFETGPSDASRAPVPSADVLFQSAADVFGAAATAVVLTGMGRDGTDGVRAVRAAGGRAIVQDRASSAIYGMPRSALTDAGADVVIALEQMAGAIVALVSEEPRAWQTA